MNLIPFLILLSAVFSVPAAGQDTEPECGKRITGPESVIPIPYDYRTDDGTFEIHDGMKFFIGTESRTGFKDESVLMARNRLSDEIRSLPFRISETSGPSDADLIISMGAMPDDESYTMRVEENRIYIHAPSAAGAFYAIQSLAQMTGLSESGKIACCTINDRPRFPYRGLHFDVSRHFRSKEFLMKQMDAMALLKLNRMHLHLTDGAGWRLEIGAYPGLTEFAAWRPYRKWSDWQASHRHYCKAGTPGAYGGYYTEEDIREILDYAERKHIEIIPEIEMPGHSEEVIAVFPELSCSGMQYGSGDLCPGKEETFIFLENVLTEVMDLFPSEYVHIGGDEASKEAWKTCPDCRRRMQEEGLETVDELQSYFIRRIGNFVNSRGKKIIGWDEIMQGGLAPNATVMSWRGTEGGLEAARAGHDVIMTPNSYCYLDYTQDAPFREPVSIGGYVTLERTYSYDPAGDGTDIESGRHILGVQGNLWSEYITEDSHAEYMYYPRAFAIAETGWSRAESKDYGDFRERSLSLLALLGQKGYTVFDLGNEYGERKESLAPVEHLAVGSRAGYSIKYDGRYPASGDAALTDGLLGGWSYGDGRWQGFLTDVDVTVDLGASRQVHYIGATFMQIISAWVYLPEKVEISVSGDGAHFRPVGTVFRDLSSALDGLYFRQYGLVCNENCRYIRLRAEKPQKDGAWLFTDEIIVN